MITAPTVVPESHNKESAQLSPPSEGFRTYPDEDKIESVLDVLHSFAWEQRPLSRAEISELLKQLAWVQSIWNKSMGSTRLADLQVPYVRTLSASNDPKEIS